MSATGPTAALILAGGQARRMGGGDKPLIGLGGYPILYHIVYRLRTQAPEPIGPDLIAISANGDPARFATFGLPVLPDGAHEGEGPLAGVLAGLLWAQAHPRRPSRLLTLPGDTPFLPADLLVRLCAVRAETGEAVVRAVSAGRRHHALALWEVDEAPALEAWLAQGRQRRMEAFASAIGVADALFSADPYDPFLNINTPEDLAAAEALLAPSA
ncbi:MAG: molybdenum cofactor guanylyltransferase MobA [Alphaproteobacteria bacterium]|nr:molybdenum cofactor guanylyltransferase MobA [Alphaproteobacteria bacterium]